jgi:hypothetical protein
MTRVPTPSHAAAAGPFQTEGHARAAFANRAPGRGGTSPLAGHRILCEAIIAAGVTIGDYDHQVVLWLARGAPEHCAVVAGLITRASD